MMQRPILPIFAVGLFLSISARAGEPQRPEWKGKLETKGGLTIVSNPKAPLYPAGSILLKEELSVGEAEGNTGPALVRPWSIVVDKDENMYVMDAGDTCVKIFDDRGNFTRRIGSKGQGPGELQNPNSIHLIGGRRLIFEDFIRGLNTFSLEGRFLGFLSTAGQMLIDVAVTPENRIVARVNADPRGPGGKELRLYDDRLNPIKTLLAMPEEQGNPQVLNPFPVGFRMALDGDERVIVSFKDDYEIEVLDLRGSANKRITRKYDRIKIGKEEIDGAAKYARGRKVEAPERHQAVRGLATDDAGRIYAATLDRTPDGKSLLYDVFDREGRYLAQVPVPPTAKSLVWLNRKLYCLDQDNEGLPIIKRYAVLWRIPD